jgi:hypothetical protein
VSNGRHGRLREPTIRSAETMNFFSIYSEKARHYSEKAETMNIHPRVMQKQRDSHISMI